MTDFTPPRRRLPLAPRLRELDRRIGRLLRRRTDLELAEALLERADTLLELDEEELAWAQLEEILRLLERLEGRQAHLLIVATLLRGVRLGVEDPGRAREGLLAAERALDLIDSLPAKSEDPAERALAHPRAELRVHRGHLLRNAGHVERARVVLEAAITASRDLPDDEGARFEARARRELALALAETDDLEAALLELDRADAALLSGPASEDDKALLLSTRGELQIAAGRVIDALRLLEGEGDATWAELMRSELLEVEGRLEDAGRLTARTIERLREQLDEQDLDACLELAETLLMQARRLAPEQRAPLAGEAGAILEGFFHLPPRGRRLWAHALEVQASTQSGEEAFLLLRARTQLLEELLRELDEDEDRIELLRTWMLAGDALMGAGNPWRARPMYRSASRELERFHEESRHEAVVAALLPLAYGALAQALAACGLWLAARDQAGLALRAVSPRTAPPTLAEFGEVYLFHAMACVTVGAPEQAAESLAAAVGRLVTSLQAEPGPARSALIEAATKLALLRAEVLADHLGRADEATESYDQALTIAAASQEPDAEAVRLAVLSAKGAMLNDHGKSREALPLLEECLNAYAASTLPAPLIRANHAQTLGHLAATLVQLGRHSEALDRVLEADRLLESEEELKGSEEARRLSVRAYVLIQRGEAMSALGHSLLAADELGRSVDLLRRLLEEDAESRQEATHQLPYALLLRARCWIAGGEQPEQARSDLREARKRYRSLVSDEGRPEFERRLDQIAALEEQLGGTEQS